ncbi:hypothetical protein [Actinomadura rudentiformis]|uniref:Uncharacterized protein n=1 Tax=Actinomadura rudentiformis TaxID=359158 RepID=A0A6H9Y9J7_9ACTN|nr:hypothetical protein [Actinomadura rudentiformis]KAB2341808.1 hypothetical protein F8566_40145 [Actinomadura rudentiformis]
MRGLRRIFRRRREDELAEIDAEITAFGEALARHSFVPENRDADEALLADYGRALDAYEQAKRDFVGDRDRLDASDVLRALDEGRHALACVDARLSDEPPPPRRPLCFFDARHGPSTEQVDWAPPEGAARLVDVCAADAVRLSEGLPPIATGRPPRPGTTPRPRPAPDRGPKRSSGAAKAKAAKAKAEPPFTMWPKGLDKAQRAEGQRGAKVTLLRPYLNRPLLLVVRLQGHGKHRVDLVQEFGTRALLRDKGRTRLVVPLSPREVREVRVHIETSDRWWAWLLPADAVPLVSERFSGRGWFVFRYEGGPRRISIEHKGRGAYSLSTLTPALNQGEPILTGMGTTYTEGELPGPALVHLRAAGEWTVRFM